MTIKIYCAQMGLLCCLQCFDCIFYKCYIFAGTTKMLSLVRIAHFPILSVKIWPLFGRFSDNSGSISTPKICHMFAGGNPSLRQRSEVVRVY